MSHVDEIELAGGEVRPLMLADEADSAKKQDSNIYNENDSQLQKPPAVFPPTRDVRL